MRTFRMTLLSGTAAVALSAAAIGSTHAQNYIEDNTMPVSIPGLTSFQTSGDDMTGLVVTATFETFSQQLLWATTGVGTGGVSGTGWSLTVTGDTFGDDAWSFTNDTGEVLLSLMLDGNGNFTVFDRTEPNTGTPGSAQGKDWFSQDLLDAGIVEIDVTYSSPVGIGALDPVGDLFQKVTIEFGQPNRVSFNYSQDADNDVRATQVPEPLSAALLGMGLLGLGFATRRRRSA